MHVLACCVSWYFASCTLIGLMAGFTREVCEHKQNLSLEIEWSKAANSNGCMEVFPLFISWTTLANNRTYHFSCAWEINTNVINPINIFARSRLNLNIDLFMLKGGCLEQRMKSNFHIKWIRYFIIGWNVWLVLTGSPF